jgi:hypothetical protein
MITKLKQTKDYPLGDCQRTVFASLLGYDDVEMVPNFVEMDGEFVANIQNWLKENNLQYVEMTAESFEQSPFIPTGYCAIAGKSPRGDYLHSVVGEVRINNSRYELWFVHDPSPHHDKVYLEDIQFIGFLSHINFHGGNNND